MIQRVYEQAIKADKLMTVLVATDDKQIKENVEGFGGNVVMTSSDHRNGTERCLEALTNFDQPCEFVINIQGDEPFINPEQINSLASILGPDIEIATLAKKIESTDELDNHNINKVVFDSTGDALYFSRSTIPYNRFNADNPFSVDYYKHIGIYAYRVDVLKEITKLEPTPLELAEALEQLRWLQNGYNIKVGITELESMGIDTPEDLERALKFYNF